MRRGVLDSLSKRPGVDIEIINNLYDDAIQDICEFCNISYEDVDRRFESVIKDLMMFRYNTLGTEGLRTEIYPHAHYQYERDIPARIKTKLRSYRRLSCERSF